MARAIDGDELLGIERLLDTDIVRQSKTASWLLDQVLHDIQAMPILSCVTNHPELKQAEWYKEKMKCATPADGLKRLLRKGEVEKICRTIDLLHGYSVGSVVPLPADQLMGAAIHAAVEDLEKN